MTDRLDKIRALVEDERDTAEHCIDINHADYLLAEVERWKGLAVHHETVSDEARMNLLIERAKRDKAEQEIERLRAALTDVSFRCERCGLDFAADGIDATNRCYQCHNDVHFGQPTVQWNPILDDIGNTTITKGGES